VVGTSAEEFVAVCYGLLVWLVLGLGLGLGVRGVLAYCVFALFAESVELCAVVCEFIAEVLNSVEGFLLLLGNQFFLGKCRVIVDCAG